MAPIANDAKHRCIGDTGLRTRQKKKAAKKRDGAMRQCAGCGMRDETGGGKEAYGKLPYCNNMNAIGSALHVHCLMLDGGEE